MSDAGQWISVLSGTGGAAAIGAFTIWHMLTKHIPRLQTENRKTVDDLIVELRAERQAFREELAALREAQDGATIRIVEAIRRLEDHMAALAGRVGGP